MGPGFPGVGDGDLTAPAPGGARPMRALGPHELSSAWMSSRHFPGFLHALRSAPPPLWGEDHTNPTHRSLRPTHHEVGSAGHTRVNTLSMQEPRVSPCSARFRGEPPPPALPPGVRRGPRARPRGDTQTYGQLPPKATGPRHSHKPCRTRDDSPAAAPTPQNHFSSVGSNGPNRAGQTPSTGNPT